MADEKRGVGQHHGDLGPALLTAALGLIDGGDHAPSLRAVARAAGVSPAAPYHHFGSKEGLLAAVAEDGFVSLNRALRRAGRGAASPAEALRRMNARYVTFALEHGAHYRVMFSPELGPGRARLEAVAREAFGQLVAAVAVVRPDLDGGRHLAVARAAWAHTHGSVLLALDNLLVPLGAPAGHRKLADEVSRGTLALVLGSEP